MRYARLLLPLVAAAIVIVVGLAVTGGGGDSGAAPRAAAPSGSGAKIDTIEIRDFKFMPATAKVGTRLTFDNVDTASHTATADAENGFDTGVIDRGAKKTITLNETGTIPYHCELHPFMKATITVVP